jgi:hypothetical protein
MPAAGPPASLRQWANGFGAGRAGTRLPAPAGAGYNNSMTEPAGIWGTSREWVIDLTVATGIGAFLGLIGPFGSFNGGPLGERLLYWVASCWIGLFVLTFAVRLSLRTASRLHLPVWFALLAGVAIGAVPLGAIVALFSAYFWTGLHGHIGPFLDWYGQTLAVAEPCAFGYYFIVDGRRLTSGSTPSPPPIPPPIKRDTRFLDRLPARLGRNLLCLQMEDHYVRAHTDLGSDLILTPLKDAMAELAEIDGLQVHRSWWVAKSAVAAPIVKGRNYALRLTNGLEVPVSRASVAKARAQGWL